MVNQIASSGSSLANSLSSLGDVRRQERPDLSQMKQKLEEVESTVTERMGLDPGTLAGLRTQIEEAMSEAVLSSEGSSDPRMVMDETVKKVFENNGIDFEEFKTQMRAVAEEKGMPAPPPGHPPSGQFEQADASTSDPLAEATSSLLDFLGVDSEETDEDLSETLLNWLRNLPAGSDVNILA